MAGHHRIELCLMSLALLVAGGQPTLAQDRLPTPTHWAANLDEGEMRVVDGIVSIRQPILDSSYAMVVPGVPLNRQPDLDLNPLRRTDSVRSISAIEKQAMTFLDWTAEYYGRSLPPVERRRLGDLYRSTFEEARRIRATPDTAREAMQAELGRIMTEFVTREARLFARFPRAQKERFGEARPRVSLTPADRRRLELEITRWLAHDAARNDTSQTAHAKRSYRRPGLPTLDERRSAVASTLFCSADTVVRRRWDGPGVFTGDYEARVYRAESPVQELQDFLETHGIDADFAYHSSVGGGIWALIKRHRITQYYERPCIRAIEEFEDAYPLFDNLATEHHRGWPLIRTDTTTVTYWINQWKIANGAAGEYAYDDDMVPVLRAWFPTSVEAGRWLYTPEIAQDTHRYHRIRAAAYSIGTYGLDWVCHQTANAFAIRRWNVIVANEPVTMVLYGPTGVQGISARRAFGIVINGCVPGSGCYYNVTPPWPSNSAISFAAELPMTGHGWDLDRFWSPRQNDWLVSEADYTPVPPHWSSPAEIVSVESGAY